MVNSVSILQTSKSFTFYTSFVCKSQGNCTKVKKNKTYFFSYCFCLTWVCLRAQQCVRHGLQLPQASASSHGSMANGRPGAGWD